MVTPTSHDAVDGILQISDFPSRIQAFDLAQLPVGVHEQIRHSSVSAVVVFIDERHIPQPPVEGQLSKGDPLFLVAGDHPEEVRVSGVVREFWAAAGR